MCNYVQHGRTALHVAGNVETARALIAAGADLNARDEVRKTGLIVCRLYSMWLVVECNNFPNCLLPHTASQIHI